MTRAMIVVAAGSGSRFEEDKMLAMVAGTPMVAITVARVRPHVDRCVLVCHRDHIGPISDLGLDVEIVTGGSSRTASETAGLAALGDPPDLIGIHDGARPNIAAGLIERLFDAAGRLGGAVPVVATIRPVVDRVTLVTVPRVWAAQTPQVFAGPLLMERYRMAAEHRLVGQDTFDVVIAFGPVEVAAVPGDEMNIKVTYPDDLSRVRPLPATAGNGSP